MGDARVLIVGAGPAGMATAACLHRLGVDVRLVDRNGRCGGAYRHLYEKIEMASPARWISLPLHPLQHPREYITIGEYRDYLDDYAAAFGLDAEAADVTHIEPDGDRLSVTWQGGASPERYEAIVAASGMVDYPYRPSIDGLDTLPHVMHARDWRGPEALAGGRMLIVGGGTAAVETAEESAQAGVHVVVSTRPGRVAFSAQRVLGRDIHDFAYRLSWLPRSLLGAYCDRPPTFSGPDRGFSRLVREGRITVRGPLRRFEGADAVFAEGPTEAFDLVVLATGYRHAAPYLPQAVPRASGGHALADGGACRGVHGLYIVGSHCARGVSSQFLRGIALDAPLVARTVARRLTRRSRRD